MKLDFSALAQPVAKVRGQMGTQGTQASTPICASPLAQRGAGTFGDKPDSVAHGDDLVVAVSAICPPVSPACPQLASREKSNVGAVSPVSPIVPTGAKQVAVATGTAVAEGPHLLGSDETDSCFVPCWDDAEISLFIARMECLTLLGRADANDLAQRLIRRDREGDDRHLCLECAWLDGRGRCLAAAAGCISGAGRQLEPVTTILQRCDAFELRKGLG